MNLPASVANKRLTVELSPLDATLTKNRGVGVIRGEEVIMVDQHPPGLDVWTFRRSHVPTLQRTLHSLFSFFAQRVFHNSFPFTGIHTLSKNSRGVPQLFPFWSAQRCPYEAHSPHTSTGRGSPPCPDLVGITNHCPKPPRRSKVFAERASLPPFSLLSPFCERTWTKGHRVVYRS
jgi:hypothetical protein